jgi:nucleoside-diphosphate-sugar epimerase
MNLVLQGQGISGHRYPVRVTAHFLLTGASGFLGSYLRQPLQRLGSVATLGRNGATIAADLERPETVPSGSRYRYVIHSAGYAHRRPRTEAERERFFRINRDGTVALLRALEGVEAFVLISTVAVFGCQTGELVPESAERAAQDAYGRSKIEAEDRVLEWGARTGCRIGILRLPLIAGSNPPGNLGAMIRAMRKGWYVGIGPGEARRSMVLASDVAAAVPRILEVGGTYTLTDGAHPRLRDLEEGMAKALGRGKPWRVPMLVAQLAGHSGDLLERFTGKRLPMNQNVIQKLTATLTFSDKEARHRIGWCPVPVLERLEEIVGKGAS